MLRFASTSALVLLALAPFSASKAAELTVVRHPIFVETDKVEHISIVDEKLSKQDVIPYYFEVTSEDTSESADSRYNKIASKAEKTLNKVGGKYASSSLTLGLYPSELDTGNFVTCYRGDAESVPEVAQKLVSMEFTEQLTIYATRTPGKTLIDDNLKDNSSPAELKEYLGKEWKNYKASSGEVLMLGSVGDDGTDRQVILIKPCAQE